MGNIGLYLERRHSFMSCTATCCWTGYGFGSLCQNRVQKLTQLCSKQGWNIRICSLSIVQSSMTFQDVFQDFFDVFHDLRSRRSFKNNAKKIIHLRHFLFYCSQKNHFQSFSMTFHDPHSNSMTFQARKMIL